MNDFIMKILDVTAFDSCEDIWWRTDEEYAPVTFFVNCNDLFFWACADCEAITESNIDAFSQAYKDAKEACAYGETWAAELFCCRQRKMRPQKPYYKNIDEKLRPLFDACGPERND